MSEKILVYGHPACPAVPPVRAMLAQANVAYEYINIRQDGQAAVRVRTINGGNESVPTLVFPDGTTLTEPSTSVLKRKLEAMGYQVSPLAWLLGNSWLLVMGVVVLFALLRLFGIF